ncbi:MAG: 16S rRNA processing protein RimM [Anaerolineae bacterium]|nr:16S rRNA processing protein RimM [Anaerolineae bacterium]
MLNSRPEPRYLAIGRILRPHGIDGELRMEILTDYPERVARLRFVYVGNADYMDADVRPDVGIRPDVRIRRYHLRSARLHKDALLIKLEGCEDRNTAETFRGAVVAVSVDDAIPLDEGEYYHFQMVGTRVETETGEVLGEVVDVLSTPNVNDVYVVHGPRGELLLPAIKDVILDLDLDARRMVVHLIPGLVDID